MQRTILAKKKKKGNDYFTPCVKELFHTITKRQTGYSWFAIPISTILVTKHPLFMKISLSLLPNALLCSLFPNFLLLLSPICPHEAMDLSPPKFFPLLKFEV